MGHRPAYPLSASCRSIRIWKSWASRNNARLFDLSKAAPPAIYSPTTQHASQKNGALLVRTREAPEAGGFLGCGLHHRIVVGDSGTNANWCYVIEVSGADGRPTSGTMPQPVGRAIYIHSIKHYSAADYVELLKGPGSWTAGLWGLSGYKEMKHVETDPEVDTVLNQLGFKLNGRSWNYIFTYHDCGTFGNFWSDLAKELQLWGDDVDSADAYQAWTCILTNDWFSGELRLLNGILGRLCSGLPLWAVLGTLLIQRVRLPRVDGQRIG